MRARKYIISMTAVTIVLLAILLSIFRVEMNYQREQYGYLLSDTWNHLNWTCIAVFLILIVIQIGIILKILGEKEKQIDCAEEMLADILEQAGGKKIQKEQWAGWKKKCQEMQIQGAIGRLGERIWETAQIIKNQEGLKRKEQAYLKDLMNDISHQMKTPLASLQVFIDIFEKELQSQGEEKTELAKQAQKQIERMRWLVMGMLKLAQLESGILEFDRKKQSLNDTLKKSVDSLQTKLQQKDVQVVMEQVSDSEEDVLLVQDSDWLQEAYTNILKNAIEYAPVHSMVKVVIEQTSLAVTVSIEDKGEGISEKELPKIFNRFYRVHKTGQSEEGVGIGLALAKRIVESQGGVITVYSQTGAASYTRFVTTFLTKL